VCIPYASSELVDVFHRLGQVEEEHFREDGTIIMGFVPIRFADRFSQYELEPVEGGSQAARNSVPSDE
jgi:hypothetical protein